MITVSHKNKQYLLLALKVLILAYTFSFIYLKVTGNETFDLNKFTLDIFNGDNSTILSFTFFVFLAAANWFFEILKWKVIISEIQSLSFLVAMKQSLFSLTVSLSTPNRIGEYGAKAYFFKPDKRKNILLLTFFSNSIQMGVTTFFGILGFIIVLQKYKVPFSTKNLILGLLVVALLVILGFIFKRQQLVLKNLSILKVVSKFKKLPFHIKFKTVVFSICRYLIFSFLFYSLLQFFGADISLSQSIPLIFSMYLMVSIIPTIFIFDVVIRGGAALWMFSLAGVSEITILSTVLTMWVLNFVIPALFGSYFLFSYKPDVS